MFGFYNTGSAAYGGGNMNANMSAGAVVDFSTLQKARRDLIGEWEAVIQYDDHLNSTSVKAAKETWENIRNEELVHVGELLALLNYLAPYQMQYIEKGIDEFNERINKR